MTVDVYAFHKTVLRSPVTRRFTLDRSLMLPMMIRYVLGPYAAMEPCGYVCLDSQEINGSSLFT